MKDRRDKTSEDDRNVVNVEIRKQKRERRYKRLYRVLYESERSLQRKRLQRYAIGLTKISMVKHKERRVDALALRADERRDKLRKASGSCK